MINFHGIGAGAALLLVALLRPGTLPAQHFPPDAELELMLRYIVEDTGTPGIVLGVLEADGSTRVVTYGSPGPDARPLGPRSGFQIASVTKVFTATLLADMVRRGEVALEDPVASYLPPHVTVPSAGDRQITLLDLATHRSALPPNATGQRFDTPDPFADFTVESLYEFLATHELRGVPGAGYRYSNVGYGLLGHALARAAGRSYRDLIRERIAGPLGMELTRVAVAGEMNEWMVRGHRRGEVVPHWYATEAMQGAGAVVSSAEDLLAFLAANIGPPTTDLERAMRDAQQVRVPDRSPGTGWGFSWRTGSFPDGTLIRGHGGQAGGFRSRIAFAPDRQVGVVVLTNDAHYADDLETTLLYLDPPATGWEEVPTDRDVLARYTGTYRDEDGSREFFLRLEDEGYLTYQARDSVRTRLYARSDTTFQSLRGPVTFTLSGGDGSEHPAVVIREDERSRRPERAVRVATRLTTDTPAPAASMVPTETSAGGPTGQRTVWIGLLIAIGLVATYGVIRARSR